MRWQERRHRASETARELRQRETVAEDVLWRALRGRQLGGHKFRRQHGVGIFVLDFCCPDRLLGIEVDGPVHDDLIEHDEERSRWLEANGYQVIRFCNDEVLNSLTSVLERIQAAVEHLPPRR